MSEYEKLVEALNDSLSIQFMDLINNPYWKYDNNTTTLTVVKNSLASLLERCLKVSDEFKNLKEINLFGLMASLSEILSWMMDNTQMVQYNGDIDGMYGDMIDG